MVEQFVETNFFFIIAFGKLFIFRISIKLTKDEPREDGEEDAEKDGNNGGEYKICAGPNNGPIMYELCDALWLKEHR